jgi:hypothetical protein
MVGNRQFFYISPEVYLEGERVSPIKHEYRRGEVYAMVGARKPHIVLASNLTQIFSNHLIHSPRVSARKKETKNVKKRKLE